MRSSGQVEMQEGRFFTESENQHRMPVAVIGEDVYRALFERRRPDRQVDRCRTATKLRSSAS